MTNEEKNKILKKWALASQHHSMQIALASFQDCTNRAVMLAGKLDVTERTIHHWKKGRVLMTPYMAFKIEALKIRSLSSKIPFTLKRESFRPDIFSSQEAVTQYLKDNEESA